MVAGYCMPTFINSASGTYVLRFVALSLIYGVVAWVSISLVPAGGSGASLVSLGAAVGLTGLLLWGSNLWPAITLSLFLILMARGLEPAAAAGVAAGNTAESLLGVYILTRAGFHPLMSRLRDSLALILAAFICALASATVITASTMFFLGNAFSLALWEGIWLGHAVSLLSFGPFAIRWGYRPLFRKTLREVLLGIAIFGSVAALNILIFWTPYSAIGGVSLIFVLIVLLIWVALRTGPRGTSLSLFMTALISIGGVLWGQTSVSGDTSQMLFGLQMMLGTLSLIFILFTSITEERKEAVIALEGHVGQLEDALEKISSEDKAKSEFIAILAHELRNPLSPVLSGLEILKARAERPDDVHVMMGAHLNTLARLLDDLLDITRISHKKFKLERETTTLQAVLERSFEMVEPYVSERGHAFTKEMPAEEIHITADPVRLAQVFVNLLNNAAKYTPPGGTISILLTREGPQAVVRVRDSGQGIAPGRLQKIFEPFAGGTPQRNQGPGGLHIGLSLAKRMVELHHGQIEARSLGSGHGSEFIVRLPLPEVVQVPLVLPESKKSRGRFSKEAMEEVRTAGPIKILVVDDNEAAAKMLCTLLEHHGHRTAMAHSGQTALDAALRERPQVALLDLGLPDVDGYEVGRRLRAEFDGDISLIAVTGYGQEEDRVKTKQAGFDEHLVKPVSIVDVERALSQLRKHN